jgi:ABC-type nickel/cobalt efflux system permease component RcnA
MAEIPTFQERARIDTDGNGAVDEAEGAAFARAKASELSRGLVLRINGEAVTLRPTTAAVTFPPGQGGLSLLRLTATFETRLPDGWRSTPPRLRFEDNYYSDRLGWREIVVRSGAGIDVGDTTAPAQSITDELTRYPTDALSSPLDVRAAEFAVTPGSGTAVTTATEAPVRAVQGNSDSPLARFAGLVAADRLSAGTVILALLAAIGFGAIHALSPGHGKTVVAAYLVGSRGTLRHALLLGVTVTLTHTASVYALGFATLYLSAFIVPEDLYPWLGVTSGGLIVTMGLSLLYSRLNSSGMVDDVLRWAGRRARSTSTGRTAAVARGEAGAVVVAQLHHDDGAAEHDAQEPHGHHHDHGDQDQHSHGFGAAHSHKIPGQDGEPVTWRQLIGLGMFGGMLPCPSAIVVMLSAISLHRVGLGLVLIVAFSAGLAGVLTAIGFALVVARRLSSRLPLLARIGARATRAGGVTGVALRAFPSMSAAAVVAAGAVILLRALAQQGLV